MCSKQSNADHLSGDERPDHLSRAIGLWPGIGNPLVLGALEQLKLDFATGGFIGLDKFSCAAHGTKMATCIVENGDA